MSFFDEIRDQIGAAPEGAPIAPTPDAVPAAPRSASPSVGEFVAQVAPAAIEAGRRLGVDPSILIGQWGLETGWGKSVIPGTNNLGNIKDFSGNGIAATDNMTGSRDRYRQYASINDFGSDYAGLIERRYGSAIGAGQDAVRYAEALKAGGYAEDPAYVEKMARAAEMVRGAGVGLGEGWNGAPAGATQRGGAVSLEPDSFLASGFEALEQRDRQEASDESPMSTNLSRGWRQMSDSLGNYISLLEGDEAAIVERLQEAQKFDAENPMPTATAKFYQDWTDENYLTAMINVPGFAGGMVEQLANSLPSMIGSIPGMIAGGVAGAAAGPVGVLLGASAGGALGSAPGSVALETGARISGMAGKAGVDVSNPAAFQAWLTENRDAILAEGMSKGLTVAAIDGIAGGVGSAIIARPALRLQQAERRILERMGVNGADEFAVAAARRTPQYQTALKPFKAEFEVANTAGANAMRGFASFAAESMGEFGGEYAGEVAATGEGNFNEALLEGVMGAGQSAVTTGAQFAAKKIMQPNSPLTNAANMATASTPAAPGTAPGAPAATAAGTTAGLGQPGSAVPGTPGAAPGTDLVATDALSDDAARLQRIQSFAEDKAFLSALRSNPAYGKESASEFLSAYAKARNPNIDPLVRARAMDDIESFIRNFENRPNFTMGGAQAEQGGDQQQAGAPDLFGAATPQLEAPAFAERDITPRAPTPELETDQILQARRTADAEYDQAFQDLVKAEQLGASDAELMEYQQALEDAKKQRAELDAELEAVQRRIEAGRKQQTAEKRRAILDDILADPETANPAARFTAELQRQGFTQIVPDSDEMATIQRFEDAREAMATLPAEEAPVQPAQPAQAAKPVQTDGNARQDGAIKPRLTVDQVKQAVTAGASLDGNVLRAPGAEPIALQGPMLAAAREAVRRREAGPALKPVAQGVRDAVESGGLARPNVVSQPQQGGVTNDVPTAEQESNDPFPPQNSFHGLPAESDAPSYGGEVSKAPIKIDYRGDGNRPDVSKIAEPAVKNPVLLKGGADSAGADAKQISDLLGSQVFASKGLDAVGANELRVVRRLMSVAAKNLKVRKSVIESIPVDVMDVLTRQQLTPDVLLDNPSMLKDVISRAKPDNPVPLVVDPATSVFKSFAGLVAEKLLGSSNLMLSPGNINSASGASNNEVHGDRLQSPSNTEQKSITTTSKSVSPKQGAPSGTIAPEQSRPEPGQRSEPAQPDADAAADTPVGEGDTFQWSARTYQLTKMPEGEGRGGAVEVTVWRDGTITTVNDTEYGFTRAQFEKATGRKLKAEGAATTTNEESTDAGTGQEDGQEWSSAALRAPEGEGIGRPAGPWSLEDLNEDPALYRSAGEYLDARASDGTILVKAIDATLADRDAALGLALPGMDRPALPADLMVAFVEDAPIKGDLKPSDFDPKYTLRYAGHELDIEIVELEPGDVVLGIPPLVLHEGYDRRDGEEFAPLSAYRVPGIDGLFDFVDAVEQGYAILARRAGQSPAGAEMDADIAEQFADAAEPTDGQKEAGNYQMAHVRIDGMDVSIETQKGAQRTGADANGTTWTVTMPSSYGYIRGTKGADRDHVDIFVGPNPDNGTYYVINQNKPNTYGTKKRFDEHKVAVGFDSEHDAVANYLLSFADDFGARVFGSISGPYTADEFKALIPALAEAKPIARKKADNGVTTRRIRIDDNPAVEVTLPSGNVYRMNRLTAGESMGLAGWHDMDRDLHSFLGDNQEQAIQALIEREAGQERARAAEEAAQQGVATAKSKAAIKALGEPPHLNYRVQQTSLNGANILPPVGKKFTDEDRLALVQWLSDAGFSVAARGQTLIHVIGDGAPSIPDGLLEQKVSRIAAEEKARADKVAAETTSRAAEYASLPSSVWIESVLGGDEFANAYNKLMLARYLDGKDDFKGLGNSKWYGPLQRLGFDTNRQDIRMDEVLSFLMAAYAAQQQGDAANLVRDDRSWRPTDMTGVEQDTGSSTVNNWRYRGQEFAGTEILPEYPQFYRQDLVDSLPRDVVAYVQEKVRERIDHHSKEFGTPKRPALPAGAIPEPKNWRTSYGAAQKYAEALGVNPRGEDGKYLKLPALVAAIEASRGAGSADVALTNEGKAEVAEKPSRKWPNEGAHFHSGASAFGDGLPRVLPTYFKADAGKNAKDWYRGWDAANLASDPTQSATSEVDSESARQAAPGARINSDADSAPTARPQLGEDGYTLQHAQEDLAALREKADDQGSVVDARLLEKISTFEQIVEDLRWNGAEPDYRAGHAFTADGGEQWVIQKNVRPGDDTITVIRTKDGRPYTYGRSFVESEMRVGQEWLEDRAKMLDDVEKRSATERKTAEPKSLDDLRAALEAGDKAHFDYAGAHGRTLWIDDMGEGMGWALHSKEDDSQVVTRTGGDPRSGGYSKEEAIARALADAQYRFTEWKPVAEQQSVVDQILVDKVKALTERGVEQSQINQAVAEYKDGDATLIDDLLRISATEAPADTAPAATDDDLDAMFDEILAEELAAKPNREKKASAPKAEKPTREMTAAEKARKERLEYAKESKPRGAGASAKSAAKNTAAGLSDAIAGLGKLFGGNGRLSSGLTFDEETYEKAKPLFKSAIAHFKDAKSDLKAVMREIVRMVLEQFGPHVAGNMKPYATRFVADVRDGKIDYDEGVADTTGENDERGSTGGAGDSSLDGAPPAEDGGSERGGDAGNAGKAGGRARTGRGRRAGAKGRGPDDGRGDGAAGVHHPAAGGVSASNAPATNFVITDDVRLGQGGEVQKFNDNLAAIRIVKQIEAERRRATTDEQRQLARYVGWGGLPNAFRNRETGLAKDGWEKRVLELESLLTRKELESARSTTTDAHYTSQAIVRGMWAIAQRLGFKGGAVLEPSMGTGNFFGLVPEALRGETRFIGIEYDSLTARIAKALYPQASVLQSGFERVPLPPGQFDLAIGNPPFGKTSLYFPTSPELNGLTIHNQFFLGSMDAVREGGLQIMVVSRYLMDAKDATTRRRLAEEAELVAAVRLPDSAFAENARTEVVTDVIVLRKLTEQERADRSAARKDQVYVEPDWIQSAPMPDPLGGDPMEINRYFHRNPSMVLGTLERSGSMRYGADVTVRPDPGVDLEAALTAIAGRLPAGVMTPSTMPVERSVKMFEAMRESLELVIGGHEEGNIFFNDDGKLTQVMLTEGPGDRDYLTRRTIEASSPWHSSLMMDADGAWFRLVQKLDENGEKVKNGRFNVYEREVFARPQDVPEELRLGEKAFERLTELAKLRDRLRDQLVLETNDEPGAALEENRKLLREDYARFVKAFGFFGSTTNQRLLDTMPDGPLVTALESDYDAGVTAARARTTGLAARKPSANPAPIMSKRVVVPFVAPERAESSRDAMTISMAETGRIDLERMAKLAGKTQQEVIDDLHTSVDDPLIFKDPETETWEVRDAYLSGLVVRKLNAARDAGLEKNIIALESVQPPPIQASDIGVQLGATWVPPDVYAQFLEHLTKAPASVRFSRKLTTFDVRADSTTPEARMRWGTERAGVDDLVASMLNSRSIAVYNYYTDEYGNQRRELDREETELAVAKAEEIKNEFADWIMGDANRRRRLAEIYNEQFNNRVIRQYDGSSLVLPGKVPDAIVELRRHQKNAIWRGVSERFMLVDHAVGAGKSYMAIARAMERRRMGLSKKPMIVVPNHMVEQFASDVYRLYPGARILALGQKDLEAKRRRRAFARIATGDWDIVIVPHSSFGFIGISQEREQDYLQQEIAEIEEALREARAEAADEGGRFKPQSVKTAEATLKGLQQRMAKITDKKRDKLLTFEQMGIDDLTIDEANEFKNLMYHTRLQRVLGLGDQQGSKKAYDLYMKVRTLRDSPRGSVVFMTGTPISNSVVEMYTMMRYLAADALEDYGIDNFDAWHKQFAEAVTRFEQNEAGLLSEKTRLSRWANMPELMKLYYSFTDAVSLDDIKTWYKQDKGHDFPVPKVKGGKRRNVVVQPTPAQVEILDEVVSGFNGLEGIKDPRERGAERLRLMDRARKVALDARAAVRGLVSDERGGKLEVASDEIARIYHEWTPDKGAQLVFLDRSTKKSNGDQKVIDAYDKLRAEMDAATAAGDQDAIMEVAEKLEKYNAEEIAELREAQKGGWTAYDQIKRNLIERGIPENQIRFIQEANTDEQKQQLFDMVKSGEVRVLIGSTPKMGAGTNVQDRLVALHHIDVNWKPSDIEQREGRIIRQGNLLLKKYGDEFEVEIIAYATERTYDGKMWALNEAKGRFIHGLRAYSGEREVEIDDSESENMAEMAALASGNPLMLERVQLDAEVKKLEVQRRAHNRRQSAVDDALADARRIIETYPDVIERAKVDDRAVATAIEEAEQEMASRTVEIEGETFGGYIDAERAALAMIAEQRGDKVRGKFVIHVGDKPVTSLEGLQSALRDALGDAEPLPLKLEDGKTFKRINNAGVEITQIINAAAIDGENEVTIGLAKGLPLKAYIERGEGGELLATLFAQGDYVREAVEVKAGGDSEISSAAGKAFSPRAMIVAISRLLRDIGRGREAKRLQSSLEMARGDLAELEAQTGKAWPKADEYAAKAARLKDVVTTLSSDTAGHSPAAEDADSAPSVLRDAPGQGVDFRPVSLETAAGVVAGVRRATQKRWNLDLNLVPTFDALPDDVKQDVQRNYGQDARPSGVTFGETVYVIADEHGSESDLEATILHEVKGHVGVRRFYGDSIVRDLNQLFLQIGGNAGIKKLANDRGIADLGRYAERLANSPMSDDDRVRVMMEEVLAHIAEEPRFVDRIKAIIGKVRAMLRETGLVRLAEYGETDLLHILKQADGKLGQRPDPSGPGGGIKSPAVPKLGEARARITETEAFKKWFGNSRVVDAEGRPLVVYHGAKTRFDQFDPGRVGSNFEASDGGFFFSSDQQVAEAYAEGEDANVVAAFLSVKNPLEVSAGRANPDRFFDRNSSRLLNEAEDGGNDGIVVTGIDPIGAEQKTFIVFRPEQVKSAAGNAGTFDPTNPSILASRKAADPSDALAESLLRYADSPSSFIYGNTPEMRSSELSDVARAFSDESVEVRTVGRGDAITIGARSDAGISTMVMRKNADGTYSINATTANPLGADGRNGMRLYQALFAYAANAGLSIIPEQTLTPINRLRRTSAMLSAALRNGTTEFTTPHPDQGVAGWGEGDFAGNVSALAEAEARMVASRIPAFDQLSINPSTGQVHAADPSVLASTTDAQPGAAANQGDVPRGRSEDAGRGDSIGAGVGGVPGRAGIERGRADQDGAGQDGARPADGRASGDGAARAGVAVGGAPGRQQGDRAVSDSALEDYLARLGAGRGGANGHGVGLTTLKRALITRALLDGETGAVGVPGMLYRVAPPGAGLTPAQFRAALVDRFGEKGVATLEREGILNIGASDTRGVAAWYDAPEGRAYFDPSRMGSAADAIEAVLHEIGEHHGLRGMLGDRGWQTLRNRLAELAAEGDNEVAAAWAGVIDNYPEFERYAKDLQAAIESDRFVHEVLAKLGESAAGRKSSVWRDLLAAINRFLLKMGVGRQINKAEIADLVEGSLKRQMRGKGVKRSLWMAGEPVMARRTSPAEEGGVMFQRPFDAADYLRTSAGKRKVRDKLADLLSGKSAKTFNWWQRTVGSQYGKARADADFGRVYEKAHDFIDDVSEFARSASDKAMGILPHMDTISDVAKGLNARRAWSDAKDYQAISDAIFTGTLEDKIWNAGELRNRFGLDDKQVALYKQFRDATDFSLETLASSEMARTARAEGMELADSRMNMAEAETFYVGQVEPLVTAAREVIEGLRLKHRIEIEDAAGLSEAKRDALIARQARERMAAEGALAKVAKLRDSFTEKAEQIRALQGKGYAPLMRFGQYTVDVVRLDEDGKPAKDDDGEIDRPFFGMFESEAEAIEAERIMLEEYPGYAVSRGVASTESSELYQGMSPEAAEMFARLLGVDVNDAFQTYLRQALNNRSAMKRLIKRKGMAGFANDIPRVLASFIASNARLASSNWHFGEMRKAAAAIPKHKGDVTDEAIKLMNYIQNPQEEAAAMRGFLFFNFLGGSLAAAIVNTTQTFSTTLPYLNQFGAAKAAKAIGGAMALGGKAMARGLDVVKDKDLHAALKRAAEDGIIDPQEIHLLMAEARGSGASNVLGSVAGLINESWRTPAARVGRAAMGAWGSFFSMAEKYNRHVAFIAAWEAAKDMTPADFKRIGVADRFEFARRAVIETQFDYTKASRPNWARGAIGATLFTFKTFLISYMEFLSRLPSRERAVALAVLFLLSGLSGAPGTDDLDDLIDTIGQKLGYNWNNESGRHAWLVDVLGKEGANFVEHGISAFIPLDVSARLGMGNLIPGTGLLKDSTTTPSREIAEIFGPTGSVFMGAVDTFGNVGTGKDPLETLRPIMPKAINDFRQAYDIASSGEYRDYRGRKVVDADLGDAFIKAIGFHPNVVAEPKRVERMVQQSVALHRTRRAEINETWARGVVEKDPAKIERAREMLRDWNRKNPTTPIRMNPESVKARVRAMRSTSAERLVKASSKDMRGMVANEIAVKD